MWRRAEDIIPILFVMLLVFSCSKENGSDIPGSSRGLPDEMFSDFVTQESDTGKVKWRLRAPSAGKYRSRKLMLLDKPTIEFYDENGELQTTLTSEKGELYEDSRDMLAYGNVVVRSVGGDVLETDSLFWNDAEEKIISNSFVKLIRGNDVIMGIGLECDYNLSALKIKKDVQARIIDEKGAIDEQ